MTEDTINPTKTEVETKAPRKIKRGGKDLQATPKPTVGELHDFFEEDTTEARSAKYAEALVDPRKPIKVSVKKHPIAKLPEYQTKGAAGMDILANITYPKWLEPGQIEAIPTGLEVAIPPGFELQIRSRSGLAKKGVVVVNGIGTIDSDFRGEIQVLLINLGKEKFQVDKGMRIAQFVLNKVDRVEWNSVLELDETDRGDGGFGSTGVR